MASTFANLTKLTWDKYQQNPELWAQQQLPYRPEQAFCSDHTYLHSDMVPRGIKLNQDMGEVIEYFWEVIICEDQDVILFCVAGCESDEGY